MLSFFSGAACGFASMKVDPLCKACQIKLEDDLSSGTGGIILGPNSTLTPTGQEIMKRCVFTVFEECVADGLGENSFCSTVLSESAVLGWTEAADHDHEKVVECALTSTAPIASLL